MNLDELEQADESELRRKADACLSKVAEGGMLGRQAALLEAEFYTNELNRRKDGRDHRKELWWLRLDFFPLHNSPENVVREAFRASF